VPIVSIEADWLNELLGREYPADELVDALEQMGCDVEDVVQMDRFRCPVCQAVVDASLGAEVTRVCTTCGHEGEESFSRVGQMTAIRIDLLAARPDLFDVGGLARALKGFLGQTLGLPQYAVQPGSQRVTVDASVHNADSYRPYIRCAVVNMPELNDAALVSLMKLQEALHWGVGRDRKLASIGVYDMAALTGDIHYRTMHPDDDPFVPLGMPGRQMSGRQILEEHPKGTAYAGLLEELNRYPVLIDDAGQVLSMPPIINSDETRVSLSSRRLFIDVTGISEAAVVRSIDTFVCSLIELGGEVESVEIVGPDGDALTSPNLTPREVDIELAAAKRWLGLPLDAENLTSSLRKMRLGVEPVGADGQRFRVSYPALRTDIKHMVDVFEDLAIGFGYVHIQPQYVRTMTIGQARGEEDLSQMVRDVMLGLGFGEIMSLPLTTEENHFERFRLQVPPDYPRIANPKLKALKVVRTHLMTGLLEHLRENRRQPMPLKFFEVDNVARLDKQAETGAREERRVAFVEMGEQAGYASIRAVVDALLFELGKTGEFAAEENPSFISGRVARVTADEVIHGRLGELHPEVLTGFGLDYPVALAEICLARVT
jgi:phenylalanyl-tRNA synthetase beta chain